MKRSLPMLALCATLLVACGNDQSRHTVQTPPSTTTPGLCERAEGLRGAEYDAVVRHATALRTRLEKNPNDVEALGRLAVVFMNEARITGDHPYYYPASMTLVDRALAIDPNDYVALVAKGSVLLSLHRFSDALAVGERAARLFPSNAIVQGILVDAHGELGNYAAAVAAADRMVAIRPDLKSYSRVSYLRELHGEIDGAIEAMRMAVSAGAPGSEEKAWARTTLGDILAKHERTAEAEKEYRVAAIERENYPFALAGLARLAHERGDRETSLRMIDSAIALVPEFSFVQLKSELLRESGRTAEADALVASIEEMLAEDEASGHEMNLELARLYADNRMKLDVALERARRELDRRPENIDAQHAMAYVLAQSGRVSEARPYIEQAMRLGGSDPEMAELARRVGVGRRNPIHRPLPRATGKRIEGR
jgi:tetratricopeptide (TPR) repeat protein